MSHYSVFVYKMEKVTNLILIPMIFSTLVGFSRQEKVYELLHRPKVGYEGFEKPKETLLEKIFHKKVGMLANVPKKFPQKVTFQFNVHRKIVSNYLLRGFFPNVLTYIDT